MTLQRQWHETAERVYRAADRESGTIWLGGMTRLHDNFLCAAARGLGYDMRPLPTPDNEALKIGKEYCNRGQCNPTYYTAGTLIRHLQSLEASGVPRADILRNNAYITADSCGPCRFGMYATEYRNALRQAGFDGFRILSVSQKKIGTGDSRDAGLDVNLRFIVQIIKAIIAADTLNLLGGRIRPFETETGATDAALDACDSIVITALENRRSVRQALRRCRHLLEGVSVDRLQPKPVVCVIGEIWAMTTEGDGNYRIQRFLEQEGAEVLVQPLYNWLLYLLWDQQFEVAQRSGLRRDDAGGRGLAGRSPVKITLAAKLAEFALRAAIRSFSRAAGLIDAHIPDIHAMATASDPFYDAKVRGGEGFMEVGKFMDAAQHREAHLVVSVKPFGCMPSSGVSDGIQSLMSLRSPETGFYAVETTGDGKGSVYSRLQMMLFNTHERARAEYDEALATLGIDERTARARLRRDRKRRGALYAPRRHYPTTAANLVRELH